MKSLVIGICGGSGSGKTTIAERLMDAFPNEAVILSHDFYYRRNDHLTFEERCKINYDHPDSLETSLMIEHLKALRDGQTVTVPQYDFTVHNRSDEVLVLEPKPIIIVEGILIFSLCGYGRGRTDPPPRAPRHHGPRQERGVGHEPVSVDGQAHA